MLRLSIVRSTGFVTSWHARIDGVDGRLSARIDGLTARIDGLESHLSARIDGLESHLNVRIDGVEGRLSARIDGLDRKMSRQFTWLVGIQVAVLLTLIGGLFQGLRYFRFPTGTPDTPATAYGRTFYGLTFYWLNREVRSL